MYELMIAGYCRSRI